MHWKDILENSQQTLSPMKKAKLLPASHWVPVKMKSGFTQEMAILDYIPSFKNKKQMLFRNRTRNYLALRKEKKEKEKIEILSK